MLSLEVVGVLTEYTINGVFTWKRKVKMNFFFTASVKIELRYFRLNVPQK